MSYKTMNNPRRIGAPSPLSAVAAAAAQSALCEQGQHDEAVAETGRVTYLAHGKRVEPGTRYCYRCQQILTPRTSPTETEE